MDFAIDFTTPEQLFTIGYIMASRSKGEAPYRFDFGNYPATFCAKDYDADKPLAYHDLVFEIDFGDRKVTALRRIVDEDKVFEWLAPPTDAEIIAMTLMMSDILVD